MAGSAPHPPSSGRRWWSSSPLISILLLVGTLLLIAKWQPGGLSSSQSLQGHLLEHLPSFSTPALPPTKHLRLYIYELPDTLSSAPARSTTEEDASSSDVWMHEFLSTAPFRTYDPAEATVFYVPIFPDHHLKQGLAMYGDSAKAHTATTQYIQDALTHIKTQHPYWSAHNGRDHLTTFTSPLGRCLHFAGLNEADFGEMFVFQPLGDLVLANGDEQVHAVAGEYLTRTEAPQTQKWPCYRKDWDIVLPVYLSETDVPSVDSQDGERPRLALYRFERLRHEFSQKYMRVGIKHDLHAQFDRAPLAGADWKANDEQGTLQDLAEAVTCVTPPDGYIPQTSLFWKAIRRGCLPVSFYRAMELPFEDQLDYSSFTINLQPSSVNSTNEHLGRLLEDKRRTRTMRKALSKAQKALSWSRADGIPRLVTKALEERATKLVAWNEQDKLPSAVCHEPVHDYFHCE